MTKDKKEKITYWLYCIAVIAIGLLIKMLELGELK